MDSPFLTSHTSEASPQPAQPPGAQAAAVSAGLVTLRTSDTLDLTTVEIDQDQARLTRMRRSVNVAARLFHHVLGTRRYRPAMLTLTYRDVDGFEPRHVSGLLKCIRAWLQRRGFCLHYVWVAELQQRGALHYHVLVWLPKGLTLPKPDKQGWWPHGSTRIEWARNAVGYLCKYVSKFDTKQALPKGARLHGAGGFDAFSRQIRRWFNLPTWLKQLADVGTSFVRVKGVGLVERDTGVCVPSPWRVSCLRGVVVATRLFTHPEALREVAGPWSALPASR